ncbi:hypothetical protein ACFSKM_16065 [Ancylobacter dichloromethanicus]
MTILYDMYVDGVWHGSKRTLAQCESYFKFIGEQDLTADSQDRRKINAMISYCYACGGYQRCIEDVGRRGVL